MADEVENTEEEPSIEDILSSIRDIISDEDEEGGAEAAAPEDGDAEPAAATAEEKVEEAPEPEEKATDDKEDDDVLDLTDVVDDDEAKDVPEGDEMAEDEKLAVDDIDAMFDTPADGGDENDPLAGIDLGHPDGDDLDVTDAAPEEPAEDVSTDGVEDILAEVAAEPAVKEEDTPAIVEPSDVEIPDDTMLEQAAATATVSSMARLAENIVVSRTAEGTTLEDVTRDLLRPMLKDWLDENLPTVIERLVSQELERLSEKAARK